MMNTNTLTLSTGKARHFLRGHVLAKLQSMHDGCIRIVDPLGEIMIGEPSTSSLQASLHINAMSFYRMAAFGGSVGAGEAYMQGLWWSDNLTELMRILVRNRDTLDTMETGLAGIAGQLMRCWHTLNRNTPQGSRKNIAAHYDLGNALFRLFLDSRLMYSSAIYSKQTQTLEDAAEAKLKRICQKLDLKPSDHVIEIGTGWGGFAIYAAKQYACRVTTTTISQEQYQEAQRRVSAEGLQDRITLLLKDYRRLEGQYDKLVSIEMIEAVGHHYLDTFFRQCDALVKDDGLMLIQAITLEDYRYAQALHSVDFIKRYIFPGSFIPCVSALVSSAASQTKTRLINLEDIGPSYARTLRDWRLRFEHNLHQVRAQGYSEAFIRMWIFYLCYCEAGFMERSIGDAQLLFAKPRNQREQWLPDAEMMQA